MPPQVSRNIASVTRRSRVSWYHKLASTAVNTASKVSMSDALTPLVRCRPHANATGPTTAPKKAMAISLQASPRRTFASRSIGRRSIMPMSEAPA